MNKSNLMTWPIAIAFCLSISTRAMCRDIFVNNLSGDDRRTGEQEESLSALQGPVRSIARALRAAGPSDRIVIANTGEPYRESVTLQGARHSGSEAFPFTIEGNGATLDGTAPVHPGSWRVVADHVSEWTPQHFDFHQLFIAGKLAQFRPIYSPFMLSELEPQQWTTWNGNVFFRADKDSLPLAYDLSAASLPVGITLYETRNVIVRDLVIRGYRLDAINAHDSVFGCQLQRVTAIENGRSGISIGGASRVCVQACQLKDNGVAQLRTEQVSCADVRGTELAAGRGAQWQRDGGALVIDGESAE